MKSVYGQVITYGSKGTDVTVLQILPVFIHSSVRSDLVWSWSE